MSKPLVSASDSQPTLGQCCSSRLAVDLTDDELLREYVRARQPEAFAQIAKRHGDLVYRACLRLLTNVHDAEDAAQAVFILLARRPDRVRSSLVGWLHQMARNTAMHLLRARYRRERHEEKAAAMRKSADVPVPDSELRQKVDQAIASLPTRLREPVLLCHLEGRRQEEAARLLGCHQSTLSRRATDGLNKLRLLLTGQGVTVSSAVLVAFLGQQSAAAVPATLGPSLAAAAALPTGSAAAALAHSVGQAVFWAKMKLWAVVAVAGTVLAVPAYLVLTPADNLVGHYTFQEGQGTRVADASGSGNHGTLVGGVTWTTGPKPGSKALRFDGKTGYIKLNQDLSSWLGRTATVSFWIKTTQPGIRQGNLVPSVLGVERNDNDDISWGVITGRGHIVLIAGGKRPSATDSEFPGEARSARPITDGVWHHIVMTRDANSGRTELFVDSQSNGAAISGKGVVSSPFATIGRLDSEMEGALYFQGELALVRFYSRLLSKNEIKALAQ
jgi:RNA polymerase sigma factor (sigma-70 family)